MFASAAGADLADISMTGGAVMSTDNAYVQADMVGLSTDVSGIVTQVSVHDNQRVARATSCSGLDDLYWLALDRAEAQIGNTRNIWLRCRPATATCRPGRPGAEGC